MSLRSIGKLVLGILAVWPRHAAGQADTVQHLAPASLTVVHASESMRLDGRLDEAVWAESDSIADFLQQEPEEGRPTTERTVVKVVRTEDDLYIGVRAEDGNVGGIRATQLRRDADLSLDDNVTLLIDSFHDRRSGFAFGTNPNGAMWDAQFTGVDGVDESWNGIWDVAVVRDSSGWTAEFRIPFRTLRFQPGQSTFGFNVQRFIRRKNETSLWRGWGRTQGLYRLIYEGDLLGLDDLHRTGDLEFKPYVLGRATATEHDPFDSVVGDGGVSGKAGVDAKLGVSATMTADFTVNTDFAQVEVDQQVINLTRFPTFFPEKRDFFLESSGLFDFATPTRTQPFYSRRIGLAANGETVPILAGARLYGRAGPWTLGVLDAQTGHGERANDLVIRAKHDLFDRSYIGVIGVQRVQIDSGGAERVAGLDIDMPLVAGGRNIEPSFWIMGSSTPAFRGVPVAWRVATDYPNDLFDNFVSLYRIDAGFNPTLGFVRRTGIWETTGHIDFTPRPHVLGIRQLDIVFPIPTWDIIANESGSLFRSSDWQTADFVWLPLGVSFQSGAYFELNIQRSLDALANSFEIFPGVEVPAGRYWWTRGEALFQSSPSHPFSVSGLFSAGDFYDGQETVIEGGLDWRPGGHLSVGGTLSQSRVTLPGDEFTATELAGRLEFALNTRTSLLGFTQYNTEAQRVDFNLRFHWIPTIGDDVYLVWNSGYTTDPAAAHRFPSLHTLGRPLNGAFILKVVHRLAL